jgi:hypothetical protein
MGTLTHNTHAILVILAIIFAAVSYLGIPTLGVAVILLGVAEFVPRNQ